MWVLGRVATAAALLLPLAMVRCRSATPLLGAGDAPAHGTVAGTVSGPTALGPVAERQVVAIELESGRRHSTKTNMLGAFSLLLPAGRYRLEVALAEGEEIIQAPGIIALDHGDVIADANVVLGGAGVVGDEISAWPMEPAA
jgi:hypothetical protein